MADRVSEPVTAATVAKRAGVSITTVSFALNGQADRYGISKETVQRVLDVAREINYVPNHLARSLRRRQTKTIGVIFPHLRNNWAHHIMTGMYPLLDREGYVSHLVNHRDSPEQEVRELHALMEMRVDGILCNPLSAGLPVYRQVIERGIPLVFFGDSLDALPEVSYAAWDPAEVAMSVQALIRAKCRRIAYLGIVDDRPISRRRRAVFEETVREAGLNMAPEHILLNAGGTTFDEPLRRMFSAANPPDGVFALYDDVAIEAMDTFDAMGLRVPTDVKVATLGDSDLIGPRAYDITTVTAPVSDEGLEAARALLRQIKKPGVPCVHTLVRGGELRQRSTTSSTPATRPDRRG
jgi:LacI family transcriptional regulator